jgi:hypothetical protein
MVQHKLALNVPTVLNDCILRVEDLSVYSEDVPFSCPQLDITAPGFSFATTIENLPQLFVKNFIACDLGLQSQNCGVTFNPLSDGVYVIRWSVSPNTAVYVEYNHLRITKAMIQYQQSLCSLKGLKGCSPEAKVMEKLRKLRDIRMQFEAAKSMVEFCHDVKKGMAIYTQAMNELNKFNCKTC